MMNKLVFATAVLLSLATGRAFAESDGNPFPFQAAPFSAHGPAFLVQTGSEAYPTSTGSTAQPSSLALLEPAYGQESELQTANSLPHRNSGSSAVVTQAAKARHPLEAGVAGPTG